MINWQSVIFNSFWILGLALILAAFSYHYWLAGQESRQLRLQLRERGFRRSFWLAVVLVGLGLIGTSQQIWEMAIWGIITVIALLFLISNYRKSIA